MLLTPKRAAYRERLHERRRVPPPLRGRSLVPLGQMALDPLHRDAVFFRREVEPAVDRAHPRRHVRATCVEQAWAVRTLEAARFASAPDADPGEAAVAVLREVVRRVELVQPAGAVQVVGREREFPGLGDVAGNEGEDGNQENGEPEIWRQEEVVVVSIDKRGDQARGESRIYSLEFARQRLGGRNAIARELTVNAQTRTMPSATAKKIQPVHTCVFSPLKRLAAITADIAMLCSIRQYHVYT